MTRFLVEAYTTAGHLADVEQRARDAADEVSRSGIPVRYVRSIYVPEDEICFHLFDAESVGAVRTVTERAQLEAQRIVTAIDDASPELQGA